MIPDKKTIKSLNKKDLLKLKCFVNISKKTKMSELKDLINKCIKDNILPKRGCTVEQFQNAFKKNDKKEETKVLNNPEPIFVKSLNKSELLKLKCFQNLSKTTKLNKLKEQIDKHITDLKLPKRGCTVEQFQDAYIQTYPEQKKKTNKYFKSNEIQKTDKDLFKLLSERKIINQQIKHMKKLKKENIKNEAKGIRELMSYKDAYPEMSGEKIESKENYKKYTKEYINHLNEKVNFQVTVGDSIEKRKAFQKALEVFKHRLTNSNVMYLVKSTDLEGKIKIKKLRNMDLSELNGKITIEEDASSSYCFETGGFLPIKFEVQMLDMSKSKNYKNKKTIQIKEVNEETNKVEEKVVDISNYMFHDGEFWKWINLSHADLSMYQIYWSVSSEKYIDNCFVYACIQSGVFTDIEIEHLRFVIKTRKVPRKIISKLAEMFKCHFVVSSINEKKSVKNQMSTRIDTRKNKDWNFDREVNLILYKEHYFINKPLMISPYYLKNEKMLREKFPDLIENKKIYSIRGLNDKGFPYYLKNPIKPMKILRTMFECNLFQPLSISDEKLLETCEFRNNLPDYKHLLYNEEICTKEIKYTPNHSHWSKIYYADFETDPTGEYHAPYLCCVTTPKGDGKMGLMTFTGEDIGGQLLRNLDNNSLTYFHNLKYDACFFINNAKEYETKITERTGTILQIIFTKYDNESKFKRTLTFRNSYSIIPAPLSAFHDMFGLTVHKEIMAYNLYTETNRKRELISTQEFMRQYHRENIDKKSFSEIVSDWKTLLKNIKIAKAFDEKTSFVNIMKYAQFYCVMDCIVLMQGMNKFDTDLKKIFTESKVNVPSIHNFLSISAVGYAFCLSYGCLDGCYQISGKPQDFILRTVSGGRTMTKNNKKQIVTGSIQDFDAVSLYPSAMHIMDGIPKGKPQVLSISQCESKNIFQYDTFFIEINIKKLICKNNKPYSFGLVFHKNLEGSKIFDNQPVNHFYIDKRGLLDLIEFYDIEYEIIRGYYFNDGFNNKINEFIYKLFLLRKQYKKDKNPIEKTIKLLLNSIYGKSILKAIPVETKCVNNKDLENFIIQHYNYIERVDSKEGLDKSYVKIIKPINDHYNCPQFGSSVLSWSKHIMNKVICLAEQNDINVYYQDCDSVHIMDEDIKKLSNLYTEKYNKQLIGEDLTQFHKDFDAFPGAVGDIHSRKLIALGKKSYLDILTDEKGNEGYHIRMKGIPKQVILNKCKRMNISIEELYMRMYNGEEMSFNLLDGSHCFRKTCNYEMTNLSNFTRKVKFI